MNIKEALQHNWNKKLMMMIFLKAEINVKKILVKNFKSILVLKMGKFNLSFPYFFEQDFE